MVAVWREEVACFGQNITTDEQLGGETTESQSERERSKETGHSKQRRWSSTNRRSAQPT